jgi:hypothetical protein
MLGTNTRDLPEPGRITTQQTSEGWVYCSSSNAAKFLNIYHLYAQANVKRLGNLPVVFTAKQFTSPLGYNYISNHVGALHLNINPMK